MLGLHVIAGGLLRDTRTGHNRLHSLVGLLRQSVFGRLAGYEDVNDADRLALDPVMRQVVGGRAVDAKAASASQMGRFETEVLATTDNRTALADLSGQWIDRVHRRKSPKWITLDMDSSVSRPMARRRHRLERAFRLYVLSPAVRVQPVRPSGTLRSAPGQCPQCRRMGSGSEAGHCAICRSSPDAVLPGRCGFRHPGPLQAAGSRGLFLHHPAACQSHSTEQGCPSAQASGRSSAETRSSPIR